MQSDCIKGWSISDVLLGLAVFGPRTDLSFQHMARLFTCQWLSMIHVALVSVILLETRARKSAQSVFG